MTHHSFVHRTLCHISLSVHGTSCYLSVYPTLTSIYSFNPCWPEDTSQTLPPVVITSLLSHSLSSYFPPLPSFLFFFSAISCHSFSLSCRTELHHIPTTILTIIFWFVFFYHLSRVTYSPLLFGLIHFFSYQQVRPGVLEPNEIWRPGPVCSSPTLDWSQLL